MYKKIVEKYSELPIGTSVGEGWVIFALEPLHRYVCLKLLLWMTKPSKSASLLSFIFGLGNERSAANFCLVGGGFQTIPGSV